MEELYHVLEQQAKAQMHDAVSEHARPDFEVQHAQVRNISAAAAILEYTAENDIDLIVMGTHGRRGLRRLLLGSVAEEVVRLAPCPVLTVPERADGLTADRAERLLVPVDFSEYARLAIAYAKELTAFYAARLDLVHVVDELIYPDFYPPIMPSGGSVDQELRQDSLRRLQALLTQVPGPPVEAQPHVRAGRAAPEIATFAEERAADLIVIASHGLTGIRHILLGSVTEQLIRRAPCPVFTVKAFGKKLLADV